MISHKYFDKDVLFNNTEFTFERDGLKWANQYLMESDYKKRINTKGISKMRAKMIVIAMIFIKYIIDKTTIKEVKLSTYSLKEGVIYEETNRLS